MFEFFKNLFKREVVDVEALIERGAVILDVRTAAEFKSGHPKGAINIPLQNIKGSLLKIRNYNKPVIACCASGRRSGMAARILKAQGIEAYNGGSWNNVSLAQKKQRTQRKAV